MKNAFSLVELSIVLVILGLLVGGILAGQSLIRASELRAVGSEYQRHSTAISAFRDKYFAIPGDMLNATAFWGRMTATADCVTNSAASTNSAGSCDGNANSVIGNASAVSQSGENFQFWRQLALAGLIEGTYSGIAGTGAFLHMTATNSAPSKFGQSWWGVRYLGAFVGATNDLYAASYGSMLQFGALTPADDNAGPVLKPEEAWNIDTKLDDGKPGTGIVMVRNYTGCTFSASITDRTAAYKLTSSSILCPLLFPNMAGQ